MPHVPESTKVNTKVLREKAQAGVIKIDRLVQIAEDMNAYLKGSEAYWEGAAADEYRRVFARQIVSLTADLEELRTYTDELELYATLHEQADAEATAVANDAAQATMNDGVIAYG